MDDASGAFVTIASAAIRFLATSPLGGFPGIRNGVQRFEAKLCRPALETDEGDVDGVGGGAAHQASNEPRCASGP